MTKTRPFLSTLDIFICGPVHQVKLPQVVLQVLPNAVHFGEGFMYLKNFWNSIPGGFWYYAWQDAAHEDILDAICFELRKLGHAK